MSSTIPEFGRNAQNLPMLSLFNLQPQHIAKLRTALLENGSGGIHQLRAIAGAHLMRWNPEDGMVEVEFYGDKPWMFIHRLCDMAEVSAFKIPNQFPEPLDS